MSIFPVKQCFVSVGAEQDVWHPFWGSAHLFTDCFQINAGVTFDDKFIMDVSDDEAVTESFHGVAEYVSADGLHDILHELWTIGFDTFPFLCGSNTFIGYGFTAELILANARLHIGEKATGGKLDEEHSALVKELDATYFSLDPLGNGCFYSAIDVPPEGGDHRI